MLANSIHTFICTSSRQHTYACLHVYTRIEQQQQQQHTNTHLVFNVRKDICVAI